MSRGRLATRSGRPRTATTSKRRAAAAAVFFATILFTIASGTMGQDLFLSTEGLVTADMTHSLSVFHPGSTGYLAIRARIAAGWHINANKPLDSYLIPTELVIEAPAGFEVTRILYPEPVFRKLEISEGKMALYDESPVFGAAISVGAGVRPGAYRVTATLKYQGCNDRTCVEPASVVMVDTLRVGAPADAVEQLSPELFSKPPFAADGQGAAAGGAGAAGTGGTAPEAAPAAGGTRDIGALMKERGLAFTFVFIFLMGLALNLTPCIYPLIPITISYFGGQAGGRTGRVFGLALLYVLGMSITYSALGLVAAMTGSLFGAALQNPVVVIFIAAILAALALSMFGLWEIRLPMFLATRTGSAKQGYAGAVVMGLTMGLVAAPCIGPFVLGLLTYVGQMGKPLLGFLMFFTLAWGIGLPFLVLGTISGSIARLPRSGSWMIWVRKIFGFILVAMTFYFLRNLIGPRAAAFGYAATAVVGGIYLAWIDRTTGPGIGFRVLKHAIGGVGLLLAAAVFVVPALVRGPAKESIAWRPFDDAALEAATNEGTCVLVDFTAAWCVPCHELDAKTFNDPAVTRLASRAVPLRIDLTKSGPAETALKNRFSVRGVPTIIFIDRSGAEVPELRVTGFVDAREFERRLSKLLGGAAAER